MYIFYTNSLQYYYLSLQYKGPIEKLLQFHLLDKSRLIKIDQKRNELYPSIMDTNL